MITKDFILAGRAVFTIEPPADYCKQYKIPGHLTYRVSRAKDSETVYFVAIKSDRSFQYIGLLQPSGVIKETRKSLLAESDLLFRIASRTLRRIFAGEGEQIEAAGFKVHHEGKCGRCGRELTVPESIESGIGPECAKALGVERKIRTQLEEETERQREQLRQSELNAPF